MISQPRGRSKSTDQPKSACIARGGFRRNGMLKSLRWEKARGCRQYQVEEGEGADSQYDPVQTACRSTWIRTVPFTANPSSRPRRGHPADFPGPGRNRIRAGRERAPISSLISPLWSKRKVSPTHATLNAPGKVDDSIRRLAAAAWRSSIIQATVTASVMSAI
jgi:hypothetical protein